MPNNEMDYSLIHRTPDGNGKILVTTPGSPDKGSWETEAELKTYVNQDTVMKTDIVQSLGQQTDKVPSNAAVNGAINAIKGHFDCGASAFQSGVPIGTETRHVYFNKIFSTPPRVILCWAENNVEDIGNYCQHLQVVRSSITTTGFDAGTYRLNGDGTWAFYYFAFESF